MTMSPRAQPAPATDGSCPERGLPVDLRLVLAWHPVLLALALLALLLGKLARCCRGRPLLAQRVQLQVEGDLQRNNLATVRANTVPRLYGNFFEADLQRSRAAPSRRCPGCARLWCAGCGPTSCVSRSKSTSRLRLLASGAQRRPAGEHLWRGV
jgi:hypothetical protein